MKRKRIAIDIDDVLADFAESFVEYSNNKYGTNLRAEDYGEDFVKLWGVDNEEVARRISDMNETRIATRLGRKEHAFEALEYLKQRYDLFIVTFRISDLKDDTIQWIETNFPNIFKDDRIYFGGSSNMSDSYKLFTKGELVKQLKIDYLIDDQIRHCLSSASQGVKALLFGNHTKDDIDKLPKNIYRVRDWREVQRFFDEEK